MTASTLVTAAMLLALASPAYAAKANPRDFSDIRKWQDLAWECIYSDDPPNDDEDENLPRGKACVAAGKLQKKLAARGYCTYGKSGVSKIGRTGGKYRCYAITNLPERLN